MVVMLLNVPQAAPLQPAPDRVQVTPWLPESLVTVAVKFCVWLTCTVAEVGETLTETAPDTVTLAEPEREGSALEVAVTVTAEDGAEAGAV